MLLETMSGVSDEATLQAIVQELSKDRSVTRGDDGVLHCVDDMGFALGFQMSTRQAR